MTDFFSFYHLPSTIVKHPIHQLLHVAYSFYNVAMVTPLKDLVQDSLIIAKKVRGDIRPPMNYSPNSLSQLLYKLCFMPKPGFKLTMKLMWRKSMYV